MLDKNDVARVQRNVKKADIAPVQLRSVQINKEEYSKTSLKYR